MNNSSVVNDTQSQLCPTGGLSVVAHFLQTGVYLAVFLLALLGNIMVIMIVLKNQRMRSPTNCLIVNIATGDLLMVVFAMLPTAVAMLLNTHRWFGGLVGIILCKLLTFTQSVSISCSIFSMTALAFERFLAVAFPMKRFVNMSSTNKLVVVVWLASVLSNAPLLYATKVVIYQGVPYCTEDWSPAFDRVEAPAVFTVTSFVLQYALPLLVISPLYLIIILKVWHRKIPGNTTPVNARLVRRSKINVLKMLVTTVVAFAVCSLLMHIHSFLIYFSHVHRPCSIPWELQLSGFLLGHSNTAINCCIYVTFSQDYRRGFKEILRPFFRRRTQSRVIRDRSQSATTEGNTTTRTSDRGSVGMVRLEGMGPDAERLSRLAFDTAL